jgi:hypothetical protein
VNNKQPEWWDAETGNTIPIAAIQQHQRRDHHSAAFGTPGRGLFSFSKAP